MIILKGVEVTEKYFGMVAPGQKHADVIDAPTCKYFSDKQPIILGNQGGKLIVVNYLGQLYQCDRSFSPITPKTETVNNGRFTLVKEFTIQRFKPDDSEYDMEILIRPII